MDEKYFLCTMRTTFYSHDIQYNTPWGSFEIYKAF